MMRLRRILGLSILCGVTSGLPAATYHVDSISGNDRNDGQAPDRAWKTLERVHAEAYQPGDQILFKRGQTFRGQLYLKSSGSPEAPILITAYGSGEKPILDSRDPLPQWADASTWSQHHNTLWKMHLGQNPRRLWLSGQEYVPAPDLSSVDDYYRFFYDPDSKTLYLYATANPATFYADTLGLHGSVSTVQVSNQQYLEFADLELRGGNGAGVHLWSSHHIKIHDVVIGYTVTGISVNGRAETDQPSSYCEVYDCVLDSQFTWPYQHEHYAIFDGIFSTFGHHCVYRNNRIKNWGHTGISLYCNVENAQIGTSYNEVYDNVISSPEVSYCRGLAMGGSEGKCQYNRMYRNWVVDTRVQNQLGGDHNQFVYNIIDGLRHAPFRSGSAYGIVLDNTGEVCHDNLYANNVIRNCDGAGICMANWNPTNPHVYNNTIANNIIMDCGLNLLDVGNPTIQTWKDSSVVVHDHEYIHDNIFQNNLIFRSNGQTTVHYRGQRLTVEQWNGQNGGNRGDVIRDNLQLDPLFLNAEARQFQLQAGSPGIDAGREVGLTFDFALTPVPQGPRPDIGAYEFHDRVGDWAR